MSAVSKTFPEMEHLNIAELSGKVRKHRCGHGTESERSHLKENGRSIGGIERWATCARIYRLKSRQLATDP